MQTYRTFAQQAAIYAQGRTAPGPIVTNAAPGTSYHNYGLADDLCHLLDDGQVDWHFDMSLLLPMAPAGMEWGGNFFTFKDLPHWEFSFGYAISDLLAKYNAGNFIPGTEYVNLS
jgi:peptidoglycan L-alanyl-D-glutamate endopeptidase CwlK